MRVCQFRHIRSIGDNVLRELSFRRGERGVKWG
jgi:hypothetical protein